MIFPPMPESSMKTEIPSAGWSLTAAFLISGALSPVAADQIASDPNANAKAKATLNWLSNLRNRPDNKVVIGQYVSRQLNNTDDRTPAQAWEYYYQGLHELTGKHVGLAGFDFSTRAQYQQSGSDNTPSDSNWRKHAVEHAGNGGLLRLMWHSGNPWTDESSWSTIPKGHKLTEIITPGNPAHDTWMAWLSAAADVLQHYEDQEIPVIWGPLHEGNGDWFWWGNAGTGNAAYIAVWRHMYHYFTTTRGLHNLLWSYCPANHVSAPGAIGCYPGNAYVDIISPDKYDNIITTLYNEFTGDRYQKVFAWGEIGQNQKQIDNRLFINQIKATFPETAFYLQWADTRVTKSIRSNTFHTEVMADDWIITRDELQKTDRNRKTTRTDDW